MMGLHPTSVNDNPTWRSDLQRVEGFLIRPPQGISRFYGVGEIGLDFCKPIDRTLQLQRLTEQAALAEKRRLPIVLHCVKAYEKLLSLMDQYAVPILFHGFTGSPQLACQLIRKGYFLSFGTTLFRSPRTQEALRTTPYEHLFLETDEADTTIEEIYRQAAALRNTPIETLKHSIYTNYNTLFG